MWTVPAPAAHESGAERPKEVVDALRAAEAGETG
jgi:hypothetical protein